MLDEKKSGVILSYLTMAVNILAGVIYVPLLLRTIGQDEYGLYQLLGGLSAYAALFDFGLSNTVSRFYIRYKQLGDKKQLENMLSISRMIFWGLTAACLVVFLAIYFNLEKVFPKLEPSQIHDGKIIFILLIISFCTSIPTYVYTAVSNAEEKFIFLKGMSFIVAILNPVCVVLVVLQHPSAISVVAVHTVLNVILSAIKILYVKLNLKTKFKFHGWDKALVKSLFAFSFFIFVNQIIDQVNWEVGKTLVGIINGDTAQIAMLSIGLQLGKYYMMFSSNIASVFFAQINRTIIQDPTMGETNRLFVKVGRVQALIMGLILSGFIIFGQEFVNVWAGSENSNAYYIALALMVALFIPLVENVGISILQAKNQHYWRSIVYIILAAINVIICVVSIRKIGIYGAVLGTVISFIVGNNILINIVYKVKAKVDINALFKYLFKFVLIVGVLTAIVYIVNLLIPVKGYLLLFVKILVYCILYALLVWFTLMNGYEKSLVISAARKITSIFVKKKSQVNVVVPEATDSCGSVAGKKSDKSEPTHIVITDKGKCCGCGACVNACPLNCINFEYDEEGFAYPKVDETKCVNCGKCKKACIYCNGEITNKRTDAYACYNLNGKERRESSSGGVFSVLSKLILNDGGIVYGAAFDIDEGAEHIRIEDIESLGKLRGSKYVQSTTGECFRQVKADLTEGRKVLFSGTPCQVKGLKRYLEGQDVLRLLCVDIVCHGVPSKKMLKHYIEYLESKYKKRIEHIYFRDKESGWQNYNVKIVFEDGKEIKIAAGKDYYLRVYLSNRFLRPSCYDCISNNCRNESDITIADYWGADRMHADINDNKGLSAVIVRTQKGKEYFDLCKSDLCVVNADYEDIVKSNPNLQKSVNRVGNRKKFLTDMTVMDFNRFADVTLRRPLSVRIKNMLGKIKRKIIKK